MKALRSLVRWTSRSLGGGRGETPPTPAQRARDALARGDAARARKDWPQASAAYAEVLELDPARVDIWVQYGHALKEGAMPAEAASAYLEATRRAPNDADAWEQLAHTRKMIGDHAGAVSAFREVLFINPLAASARAELINAGARAEIPETAYGQAAAALESARLTHALSLWVGELGSVSTMAAFPQGDHNSFRRQYPIQPPPAFNRTHLTVRIAAGDASPAQLRATLTSLMDQRHPDWEAFVDAPTSLANHSVGSFAQVDARIRFDAPDARRAKSPTVLVNAGTLLDREALDWLDHALARTEAAAVYCDHDHYSDDWRVGPIRHRPQLQAMFDAQDLATSPAPPTLAIFRKPPASLDSVADSLMAAAEDGAIGHLPRLLASLPETELAEPRQPRFDAGAPDARIVVIIPTRDEAEMLARSVATLLDRAEAPDRVSILVVDNRSVLPDTAETLARLQVEGAADNFALDEPFNWPRANNVAAAQTDADILVFANNDIEMLTQGWDTQIRHWLAQPDVGVVGVRMLYPDGAVQHGGILLGAWNGRPSHDGLWAERRAGGPLGRWRRSHAAAAVTGAFMACRRQTFEAVGGFDARLAIAYNDIDFCLKVRGLGLKVLYAGEIELIHHESRTRGQNDTQEKVAWDNAELADMHARWGRWLAHDPSYNPQWTNAVNRPYDAVHDLPLSRVLSHLDASARANPWAIELQNTEGDR